MRKKALAALAILSLATGYVLAFGSAASADHTNPSTPLAPTDGPSPPTFISRGEGRWEFIKNFPANPGSDNKVFTKSGSIFASSGTLGQADAAHVGQRIVRLGDTKTNGTVNPQWIADHGSAACATANPAGTLGLQHDAVATPRNNAQLIIDSTDATGRCHDPNGGGLEFIDVSSIHKAGFAPREVHITRHAGFSHTVTGDATRPWIVYNSSSDFAGRPWIDVLDIRTCLNIGGKSLTAKRDACRPKMYRIPFEPDWSRQRSSTTGELVPGSEAACHDITATPGRIYCAGLNATLVFDVSNLTDANGNVRGTALRACTVVLGTRTNARVTDCSAAGADSQERAEGWRFLGTFNHPGREGPVPNNNTLVPANEGVSISHESDPSHDGRWMFVTDERGGGVVPPGASCQPGIDNPIGNGGIHVFDIRDPSNIQYAQKQDGTKAIWISPAIVPAASFCTVHVIEHTPGEQRLLVAYYSQGVKVLDYFIDGNDRFQFRETASLVLPGANTWAVNAFKIVNNKNGTRTYYFIASDIQRGIDVFKWTGPTNPVGAAGASALATSERGPQTPLADLVLAAAALILLPLAAWLGRRRRALGQLGWSTIFHP
jgi:hypothetical protein